MSCDVKHMMESTDEEFEDDLVEHMDILLETEELAEENELENENNPPSDPQNTLQNVKQDTNRIEVIDSDGSSRMLEKSTFLWSLRKSNKKLSSDRLIRVQQSSDSKADPEMQTNKRFKSNAPEGEILNFFKVENLQIGDWLFSIQILCQKTRQKISAII